MTILLNKALSQGLLYGGSIALMKGLSLIMLPFIAHHLSPQEFGQLEVISTLAVIGSILVGMGLEGALFRFAGSEKKHAAQLQIAADIFSLTVIVALVTAGFSLYFAAHIAALLPTQPPQEQVIMVMLVLSLEGCIAIPLAWLRMREKALHFFSATCGRALIQAVLVFLFLQLDMGVAGILAAGLAAAIVQCLLLTYWHLADTGLNFSKPMVKKCLRYSLPIVLSGCFAFVLNGLDRWVLAQYASLSEVAQLGVAAKFSLATILLMQPFGMWWLPKRFKVLNVSKQMTASEHDKQTFVHYVVLGSCFAIVTALIVGLSAPLLIEFLLPMGYHQAAQYAVALVLVMLCKELVELYNIGCFIGKTTRAQLAINVVATGIGLGFMLWLTPTYLGWGIIIALLVAQGVRLVAFYLTSQYFLPLNYPIGKLLLLFLVASMWLVFGSQAPTAVQALFVLFFAVLTTISTAWLLKLISWPAKQVTCQVGAL